MPFLKHLTLALLLATCCAACSGDSKDGDQASATAPSIPEGLDRDTELKFKQYWVQGRKLYKQYCIGCHQNEGEGMAQLIPPLAGSDYLSDKQQLMCIIRHGLQGPIMVNGVEYQGVMPANPQLQALDIAEITTYITNAWGNKGTFVTVAEAEAALKNCTKK